MTQDKLLLSIIGAILLVLYGYCLLRSLPEQHSLIMQENTYLKRQLQNRQIIIEESNDKSQVKIPPTNTNKEECVPSEPIIVEKIITVEAPGGGLTQSIYAEKPLPVLVLCHNRVDYLERTLDNLIAHRPSKSQFPIIVSQDGSDAEVWKLINSNKYINEVIGIQFLERGNKKNSYYYISQHFKFAISSALDKLSFDDVIILEDDMEVAKDFFQYFQRMRKEIKNDPSLYTASAWNDNGQNNNGRDPEKLKRSDFFPGLGWIMTKELWSEFSPKWPEGYWDDWMREPAQRKGRSCIFPEISRSWTFGEAGSSQGQFWKQYLKPVTLYSGAPIPFDSLDLSYLDEVF